MNFKTKNNVKNVTDNDAYHDAMFSTDPVRLHEIALQGKDGENHIALASNPHLFPETFDYLFRESSPRSIVWQILTENPSLPAGKIKALYQRMAMPKLMRKASRLLYVASTASQMEIQVLCNIAVHPNTPLDIVKNLAKHKNPQVRYASTENPELSLNTKKTILGNLITSKGYGDPRLFLKTLSHPDLHWKIRNVAISQTLQSLDVQSNLIMSEEKTTNLLRGIALLKDLELETVEFLVRYPDPFVSSGVAQNENLSTSAYELIAAKGDLEILSCLAGNISTPIHLLESLTEDSLEKLRHKNYSSSHDYIGIALAQNPATPVDCLKKLLSLQEPEAHPEWLNSLKAKGEPVSSKQTNASRAIQPHVRENPTYRKSTE